jgi:hypothetical protein
MQRRAPSGALPISPRHAVAARFGGHPSSGGGAAGGRRPGYGAAADAVRVAQRLRLCG